MKTLNYTKLKTYFLAFCLSAWTFTSYPQQAGENQPVDSATQSDTTFNPDDEIFMVAEVTPEFPGGEVEMKRFLSQNIRYPDMARENDIQGTVYATFIIEKSGRVNDVKIIRGIAGGCDEETWRVMNIMPDWKSAMHNGKPVRFRMVLPVKFDLGKPVKDTTASKPDVKKLPENKSEMLIAQDTAFNPDEDIYTVVEVGPQFPGGDKAKLQFIKEHLQMPKEALEAGLQGTVYTTFVVEKSGRISDIKILKGLGHGLDEEAIRIIKLMPHWKPGLQRGKPKRIQFVLPIKFGS